MPTMRLIRGRRRHHIPGRVFTAGFLLWLLALGSPLYAQPSPRVVTAEMRGIITPPMASYVDRVITAAEASQAALVVFTMDTPGGLDTSMRQITQRMLASQVPIAVYVGPSGARAGSAGMYIAMAAHVAAMAPATNIGSAHPVNLGDDGRSSDNPVMLDKVTNDAAALARSLAERHGRNAEWAEKAVRESANLTASDALRLNVIDLIADDLPDLLRKVDGRLVVTVGGETRLAVAGAVPESSAMHLAERLLQGLSDPTLAYLLLSLGGLALAYELSNPGAILPGVVGGIAVLLALYGLGTLEVGYAGVGLIVFALLLFLVDVLLAGSGVLTVGAVVSFALGSFLLVLAPGSDGYVRVSASAAIATTLGVAATFGLLITLVLRTQLQPSKSGAAALLGEIGVAETPVGREGTVFVLGELWRASAEQPDVVIAAGDRVRIIAVDGFRVKVRRE